MKILVLANTFGNISGIMTAIENEKPDIIFHLGGGVKDFESIKYNGALYLSRGKGDNYLLPNINSVECEKKNILLTYGSKFHAHKNIFKLNEFAIMQSADIVCYCDNLPANFFEYDNIKYVCPGSMSPRVPNPSYAVIILVGDKVSVLHKSLLPTQKF